MYRYFDIYSISYRCPFNERVKGCPFMEIDTIPFKEKVIWIDGLIREKNDSILQHHILCSNRRESLLIDHTPFIIL